MNVKFLHSISDISAPEWDALFNTSYPFIQHAFISALEQSGCTKKSTGWAPQHILVTSQNKTIAAMPCFLKNHSYGEYVFDWAWANAYQQHGLSYYPKLLSAIPFTPSTGARIGFDKSIRSPINTTQTIQAIDLAIRQKFTSKGISSWHLLFPEETLSSQLKQCQWAQRTGIQYHWFNRDYSSFDAFLDTFKSRKRKTVRKERLSIEQQGISMRTVTGQNISEQLMAQFYRFYHTTYLKRSGQQGYLNLEFFMLLLKHMPSSLVMVCATKNNHTIGAALYFKDDKTLYGRYWGCEQEYDFLHFETCYYQGIDFCIQQKLQRFDSGAQGEHKIPRGFEPIKTFSNHAILHPDFKHAIERFIEDEQIQVDAQIQHLKKLLPFKSL